MQHTDLGYTPHRIESLHTKTTQAIASLRGISSSDPSAQAAISAVRSLLTTLETGWIPAIVAVRSSRALTDPVPVHGFGPPGGGGKQRQLEQVRGRS